MVWYSIVYAASASGRRCEFVTTCKTCTSIVYGFLDLNFKYSYIFCEFGIQIHKTIKRMVCLGVQAVPLLQRGLHLANDSNTSNTTNTNDNNTTTNITVISEVSTSPPCTMRLTMSVSGASSASSPSACAWSTIYIYIYIYCMHTYHICIHTYTYV